MMRFRLSLAVTLLLAASPAAAQTFDVETIPGIVNTSGLNNTRFVSDVAVTNTGGNDAFLTISFVPVGLPPHVVSLPAGSTVVWRNVLQELWASSGVGALSIISDQRLIVRARTYNTAAGGTYGVALPVYVADGFLLPGGTAHSLWVSQSADGTIGYRTNIAVLFPDPDGGEATVTVFDANGRSLGRKDFSLDAAGFQQFGVGSFATASPIARAQVDVTRGHAAAYSVVVDNVTGDSSLFTFESLPGGIQDVLVNGVARANGRNSTFFRTDGRFFNPSDSDARVTVAFHANQGSNPSPATRDFTVPAGKVLDVVDVLASLLDLPVGSAGALRFTSDSAVAILCRTSNVDPTGARPGTFGAQQKPVPLLSFLSSADAGAVITGIRQNAAFRTNVGFAAGEAGAAWNATLKSKTGASLASVAGGLGPFGWAQPNIQDLFPTISIPDDAALEVKVTAGGLDVFDSSIDNASGDPVVTPIAVLPVDVPSSATIGPAGGSVRSPDGRLTLKVPAGALSAPVAFSVTGASASAPNGVDSGYLVAPDGVSFAKDALLVLSYRPQENVDVENLGLAVQSGADWYGLTGGSLNVAARTLTVPLQQASPSVRAPLAGPPGVIYETYRGFEVTPWATAAVLEGSARGVDFTVSGVGPGSAQVKKSGRWKMTKLPPPTTVNWYAEGIQGGNSSTGRISGGSTGHYSPPSCAPASNPVHIDAAFTATKKVVLHGTVLVYPRVWDVKIAWDVTLVCPAVPQNGPWYSMKWGNIVTNLFTLDDSLAVHFEGLAPFPNQPPSQGQLCPGECGYARVQVGGYPSGDIWSIEGGWEADHSSVAVRLYFMNIGIPSLTFSGSTCSPPSADQPPWPQMGFGDRRETSPVSPKGYHSGVITGFIEVSHQGGTQSFALDITPASSGSCAR